MPSPRVAAEPPPPARTASWPLWLAGALAIGFGGWLYLVLFEDATTPLARSVAVTPRPGPVPAVPAPRTRAAPAAAEPPVGAQPPPMAATDAAPAALPATPQAGLVSALPPPAAYATVTISRDDEGLVIEIEERVAAAPGAADAIVTLPSPEEPATDAPAPAAHADDARDAAQGGAAAPSIAQAEGLGRAPPAPAPPPAAASESAPSPAPRRRMMVVHTVVEGDTLWRIATRYLGDPFRYPELARLSRIPNPDLIYPGDKVKIIRITEP